MISNTSIGGISLVVCVVGVAVVVVVVGTVVAI